MTFTRRTQFATVTTLSIFLIFVAYIFLADAQTASATLGAPPPPPTEPAVLPAEPSAHTRSASTLAVNPQNRQESVDFFKAHYELESLPDAGWTGNQENCTAGATTQEFKDAILQRINYFRAMAGVPAGVTLNDTYNQKAQEAALMMSANGALNHSPPNSWNCYTENGDEGAGNSNLYLGVYGPNAISGYIKDPGSGNGAVGHRRWILHPQTTQMGTGDVPGGSGNWSSNALWVFDGNTFSSRPDTREEYVAWPPPGYVPYQVAYARWSFAYAGADFSNATVTMSSNNQSVLVTLEEVSNGFGENTLVWVVNNLDSSASWPQPEADTSYTVTINNVIINDQPQSFSYEVIIIDPDSEAPSATPSNIEPVAYLPLIVTDFQNEFEKEVVRLVNEERALAGCDPLTVNRELRTAAYLHSFDMGKNNYFSHTGLNGSRFTDRAFAAGYTGSPRGENIAAGQRTPESVMRDWMNSSGHRSNILNCNSNEIGVGYASVNTSIYGHYWTQVFGRR